MEALRKFEIRNQKFEAFGAQGAWIEIFWTE